MNAETIVQPPQDKPGPHQFTPKQLAFCQYVAQGESRTNAYKQAFRCKPTKTASASACRLWARPEIKAYVAELQQGIESRAVLSKLRKREILCEVVTNEEEATRTKLDAMRIDNDLAGHNAPVRQESISIEATLSDILKSIPQAPQLSSWKTQAIEAEVVDDPAEDSA